MQNKKEQWAVLKRLMSYLKPYGLLTFLALSFLLATTVIKSVIPLVASHFIDQYLSNLNQLAVTVLLAYYGLYLLQTLVQYVGNLLFARVSYSIVRDIRRDAFANMEKLGMSYFDKTPAGSIVSMNASSGQRSTWRRCRATSASSWTGTDVGHAPKGPRKPRDTSAVP